MKAALTIAMLKEKGGGTPEDLLPPLQRCAEAIALQAGLKREGCDVYVARGDPQGAPQDQR
jgi:hypothetical protein